MRFQRFRYTPARVNVTLVYNGNLTTTFYISNDNTGAYTSFTKGTTHISQDTAYFVLEQPNSQAYGYLNFNLITFQSAYANGYPGNTANGYVTQFNDEKRVTKDAAGTTRAYPDNPGSAADGFNLHSQNSGC